MNALFVEITRAIAETNDAELERHERDVLGGEPGKTEQPIGVIHDMEVRKLFVAARRMALLSELKSTESKLKGEDDLVAESQRLAMMADAMKELGWLAAADSLGAFGNHKSYGYALRAGWMLVYETQPQSPFSQLIGLAGR